MKKQTQYEQILAYLRKHRVGTVRDLLRYTNYPSARVFEMEDAWMRNGEADLLAFKPGQINRSERITRTWVQRNGKKVRLYCLTKA